MSQDYDLVIDKHNARLQWKGNKTNNKTRGIRYV